MGGDPLSLRFGRLCRRTACFLVLLSWGCRDGQESFAGGRCLGTSTPLGDIAPMPSACGEM